MRAVAKPGAEKARLSWVLCLRPAICEPKTFKPVRAKREPLAEGGGSLARGKPKGFTGSKFNFSFFFRNKLGFQLRI